MRLIDADKYAFPGDLINEPTIDAEPVRHGHWEYGSGFYPPTCSVCNLVPLTPGYVGDVNFYERYFKRCPNCGAKMDEVSE